MSFYSRCLNNMYDFITKIKSPIIFYLGWIFIHYVCAHLYIYYCAPTTWYGIFISPFLSITPQCNAFRWVIYETGNVLYGMWVAISSWSVANLLTYKSEIYA